MEGRNTETMLNEGGTEQNDRIQPVLELREGNTTFLIGLHFSENTREALGDKIKKAHPKRCGGRQFLIEKRQA